MEEKESSREEIRDHYESHGIDMELARDCDSIMETPAEDSPAMTGESKEERDYNDYEDSD
jgi:hypothetical protein